MHNLPKLEGIASVVRQDILKMLYQAQTGHAAGALGMADIFTALYFYLLNIDPQNPWRQDRDKLILSNGHICPVLYATLAQRGFFPTKKLLTLRDFGSSLQGHPHFQRYYKAENIAFNDLRWSGKAKDFSSNLLNQNLPGVENTSGSLGQGVSLAAGMAFSHKQNGDQNYVVCITSDGEQQEGQVWETYMFCQKYKLDNLIFILDRNEIQIDGYTYEVMPIEFLKEKYEAFGLLVLECDGNDIDDFIDTYLKAKAIYNHSVMIIAHTIAGKGVSFMQDDPVWHGRVPTEEELIKALKELRTNYEI
ncbi:transketolase [Candidatus Beckwithbacteria bacterium]|nr:transketolase [Candidatus Beckwithbacteria bacterium]